MDLYLFPQTKFWCRLCSNFLTTAATKAGEHHTWMKQKTTFTEDPCNTTHLPLRQTPPPERRAGSPRWCCSSSWRSGSVEISLALKKSRRDVSHAACFHVFFELSSSSSFSPINQSSVWVYSRVSSNSVSEALLTVLKVLLALQREEKEELSAWESAFTVRAKYAAETIMTMDDKLCLKGEKNSIAVLRAERRADSRPVQTGYHPTMHGFFKDTAADRCVSASPDCDVQRDWLAVRFLFRQKVFSAQQYWKKKKKRFFIEPLATLKCHQRRQQ